MSTTDHFDLQYCFFVVGERPLCLWDTDIKGRTLEFLESVDPTYFDHIAKLHMEVLRDSEQLRSKEAQHSALALRAAYSQALETFFSLICATIQASYCVPAWIISYRNKDLDNLVEAIHKRKPFTSLLLIERPTWSNVAGFILSPLVLEDKEKEKAIKEGFQHLWRRFASDFLNKDLGREYNSIKHGLRVKAGGFYFALGAETTPGEPAPAENMRLIGTSEFGSSYFATEEFERNPHHRRLIRHHLNWNPEDMMWGISLLSLSISNVISTLKILNGTPAEEVKFSWPSDMEAFSNPWKRGVEIRITSLKGFSPTLPDEFIRPFTKEEILSRYKSRNITGTRRIVFDSDMSTESEVDKYER